MNIQRKISIVFIISLVASILAGVFIFISSTQTREDISKLALLSDIRTNISNRANLLDEYLLYRGERPHTQWVIRDRKIDELLGEAKKLFKKSDENAILVLLEENNNTIKQIVAQLFANFPTQPDTATVSRELEAQLVGRLLITRSEMTDRVNQLTAIINEEHIFSHQRSGIIVGLLTALLFIIVLINLTWIKGIVKKLEEKTTQLDAANQQLKATNQQLRASNQQLDASTQQLRAANQQLVAAEKTIKGKMDEVERFNKLMVGRELKMVELKKELKDLKGTTNNG